MLSHFAVAHTIIRAAARTRTQAARSSAADAADLLQADRALAPFIDAYHPAQPDPAPTPAYHAPARHCAAPAQDAILAWLIERGTPTTSPETAAALHITPKAARTSLERLIRRDLVVRLSHGNRQHPTVYAIKDAQ